YTKRGDALAAQRDYAGAYAAYHQAFGFDPTNELASVKLDRMLEQQKAQSRSSELSNYDPRTGNIVATGLDVKLPLPGRPGDVVQSFNCKDASLRQMIEM